MNTYATIAEIKDVNHAGGRHFFDRSTLKFFDSKILPTIYGGCIFITSEQYRAIKNGEYSGARQDGPRKYTIRTVTSFGAIVDLSDFQEFDDLATAKHYARILADAYADDLPTLTSERAHKIAAEFKSRTLTPAIQAAMLKNR